MPAEPSIKANPAHDRQGGYSLVELAIVLAVVGLLLGGMIMPIGRQLEARAYQATSRQINDAIDAVVGFAVANRSPGMNILYSNLSGANNFQDGMRFYGHRVSWVPEGRPYLPCPDVDGDGIEDRTAIYIPSPQATDGFRYGDEDRFAVRSGNARNRAIFADTFAHGTQVMGTNNDRIHAFGVCEQAKGDLPWATLGLEKTDKWGAVLTYVVSPMFSTAAYGFDQDTRSMSFVPFYETSALAFFPLQTHRAIAIRANRSLFEAPLIVCNIADVDAQLLNPVCAPQDNMDMSTLHSEIDDDSSDTPIDSSFAKYMADFMRNENIREVTDGLPFAIISHGPNKKGGATYDIDNNHACQGLTIDPATTDPEEVNALYGSCSAVTLSIHNLGAVTNHPRKSVYFRLALDQDDYNYLFASVRVPLHDWEPTPSVWRPEGALPFDDLVGWLSRRELRERMQDAGVFPLPETFPGLYPGLALFSIEN